MEQNKYFEEWMRIKQLLEGDSKFRGSLEILKRLWEGSYRISYEGIPIIGQGTDHLVIRVENSSSLFLAFRACVRGDVAWQRSDHRFAVELGGFERAFIEGKNPPSFAGLVRYEFKEKKLAGILTEDLTHGGLYTFKGMPEDESALRSDGREFFIDLNYFALGAVWHEEDLLEIGKKYIEGNVPINLGKLN